MIIESHFLQKNIPKPLGLITSLQATGKLSLLSLCFRGLGFTKVIKH